MTKHTARDEMSRFGPRRDQEPHPIFRRRLRTYAPSRKVLREIAQIEAEIDRSMVEAQASYLKEREQNS